MDDLLFDVEVKRCGRQGCQNAAKEKYCSADCRNKASNLRQTSHERSSTEKNQVFFAADPIPQCGWRAEAVRLYREKLGLRIIERVVQQPRATIRRALIDAGVYAPLEKHNGTKRKGLGKYAGVNSKAVLAQRIAAKALIESQVKIIIERMQQGKAPTRTAKELGFKTASITRAKAHPDFPRLIEVIKRRSAERRDDARSGLISEVFPNEDAFQLAIESLFTTAGIKFRREVCIIDHSMRRVDFLIGRLAIECKIDIRHQKRDAAIGQLRRYRDAGYTPLLLLPDDVAAPSFDTTFLNEATIIKQSNVVHYITHTQPQYRQ